MRVWLFFRPMKSSVSDGRNRLVPHFPTPFDLPAHAASFHQVSSRTTRSVGNWMGRIPRVSSKPLDRCSRLRYRIETINGYQRGLASLVDHYMETIREGHRKSRLPSHSRQSDSHSPTTPPHLPFSLSAYTQEGPQDFMFVCRAVAVGGILPVWSTRTRAKWNYQLRSQEEQLAWTNELPPLARDNGREYTPSQALRELYDQILDYSPARGMECLPGQDSGASPHPCHWTSASMTRLDTSRMTPPTKSLKRMPLPSTNPPTPCNTRERLRRRQRYGSYFPRLSRATLPPYPVPS